MIPEIMATVTQFVSSFSNFDLLCSWFGAEAASKFYPEPNPRKNDECLNDKFHLLLQKLRLRNTNK
jgi:hypothetical protein